MKRQKQGKEKQFDFQKLYIYLFVIIILCSFLYRIVRGVDLTDESFYCMIVYRLAKGNQLLVDTWEQCSTAAVLPAFLFKIFLWITGKQEGIIVFLRWTFFLLNSGAAVVLYKVQKKYLNEKYAGLLSLFYLIYAPFCLYTFSYNNLSDMLMMLVINLMLLSVEDENKKLFLVSGGICAFMAFTYPTMLVLCPIMVILLFLKRKTVRGGWLHFALGGIAVAFFIALILLATIGFDGIMTGIKGILSDPAYNMEAIPVKEKLWKAFLHLFVFALFFGFGKGILIKLYLIWLWLFIVGFFMKKCPALKLSIGLYPIAVFLITIPMRTTYGPGNFIFIMSWLCPFLIFFTERNKQLFKKFLYYEYLPAILFYFVLSVSSYGGAGQAAQGLVVAALVTLKEIILIIEETFAECKFTGMFSKWKKNRKIECWIILAVLSIAILGELQVHWHTVYRDGNIKNLTEKVEKGPYKGIYTSEDKKAYLEEMTDLMQELQEKDHTALVLYHANFAYLMLDMIPATPTMWGVYPNLDNQNVFLEYFSFGDRHIPSTIFIVDVPTEYNLDSQAEKYYGFCEKLRLLIEDNYVMTEEVSVHKTGLVKKYVLTSDETRFKKSLECLQN